MADPDSIVVFTSRRPLGLWSPGLLCPWDFQARILEWVTISSSLPSEMKGGDDTLRYRKTDRTLRSKPGLDRRPREVLVPEKGGLLGHQEARKKTGKTEMWMGRQQ